MGFGDPLGMACSHAIASGMGGMRTAGDLVARMQMTRGMRLEPAKRHVAERLAISIPELSDPVVMHDVRRDLGLGRIPVQDLAYPHDPAPMASKFRIAELLGIPINSVEIFRRSAHITVSNI